MKQLKTILLAPVLLLVVSLYSSAESSAQARYGKDSIECIKNLSLYNEYYRQNNFKDAIGPWRKVYEICPHSSRNIFIHGLRMYKTFIINEKNPANQSALIDTLMAIYDKRIEITGQEAAVLSLKGVDMLSLRPAEYEKAYSVLKRAIELEGKNAKAPALNAYYQAVVLKFKDEKYTKENALEEYAMVMEIIDFNLAKKADDEYYLSAKELVNRMLIDDIKPDCQTMVGLLEPQYKASPQDTELLKKIISTLSGSCQDEDLYINAVVSLADIEKSATSFANIARMFFRRGDKGKAAEFYAKASELEADPESKSKLLYEHAMVVSHNVSESVNLCRQAITANSANGPAYLLLARHYAAGAARCAEGNEQAAFLTKAVYWAVVDICQRAKANDPSVAADANSLINSYSAHFPNSEEIFFQGLKEGAAYSINCWFTANTTVRSKN
jgi:tetratricopeptide (TPR) repeat protein